MERVKLLSIATCVTLCITYVKSQNENDACIQTTAPPRCFLPFGLSEGDAVAPANDDGSLGPITLNRAFLFFGHNYRSVWINTNGGVSFKNAVSTFVPEDFPLGEQYTIIVPFWTDIDTGRNVGRIYYRQTNDRNLLERAHLNNLRAADDLTMLVVTWHNVTYFAGGPCTSVNTFQLVLISAWSVSYVVFNYGDMQWVVSSSNILALAGYNAGDLENYYELPSSGSDDLATLAENSNVDIPGHWVFRVDGLGVRACETASGVPNHNPPSEYPLLTACSPTLTGPYVEDNLYVTFYCNVTMITTDPRARAEVTFLFDDEPASIVPVVTVSTPSASVLLHEKYLHGNMGKRLGCKVETFWTYDPDSTSPEAFSSTYYVGIQSTSTLLAINEEEDTPQKPGLYSTLPITCSRRSSSGELVAYQGCSLTFNMHTSENTYVYTRDLAVDLKQHCRYTLHHGDWDSTTQRVTNAFATVVARIKQSPLQHQPQDGSVTLKILRDVEGQPRQKYDRSDEPYDNPWYSPTLGQMKVYRTGRRRSAMCYSSGDPRMYTFDGTYYSSQQTGCFYLVKGSSSRKFEVQIRHWACVEGGSGCSIACAVVVREGNVAYGLDMCNAEKIVYPLQRSETYLGYEPITTDTSGKWMIKMPSEAFVNVYLRTWGRGGMNVYVYVPPRDRGRTEGLCGTFDGNRSNDFRKSDGSTFLFHSWTEEAHREVDSFIESWRIDPDESLFARPLGRDDSLDDVQDFCACSLHALNTPLCGPRLTLDETLTQLYPQVAVPSFAMDAVPNPRRGKRSADDPAVHEYTDNIADGYVFGDVEESSYNPHNLTWPTWNDVTEQQAVSHCDSFLRNSVSAPCLESVSGTDFDLVVRKCTEDIQITGDLDWARDKVMDVNNLCIQNIVRGSSENRSSEDSAARLQLLLQIAADTCPEQCSGYGTCHNGTCVCDSAHTGADCSLTVGEPPVALRILSPAACDIRNRPCEKVRILADKLDNSELLTCRFDSVQMDGTRFTDDVRGSLTSYNVVECPLTPLYTIDAGSGPMPFYRYKISLSNDGTLFSSTMTSPGYTSGAAVYDSTCIECTRNDQCFHLEDACLIAGRCHFHGEINPGPRCEECNTAVDPLDWTPLTNNGAPSLIQTWFTKLPGTIYHTTLAAFDPEGHSVRFDNSRDTPGVTVTESGELTWSNVEPPQSIEVTLRVEDECGAVSEERIQLVVGCRECVTEQQQGTCIEEGGGFRCECQPGYTGASCDVDIDDCVNNTCVFGRCHDLVNRYRCVCDTGYAGLNCDRNVTICDQKPCRNGGVCAAQGDTQYSCECQPYYTGATCEQSIEEGTWANWTPFRECTKACDYGISLRSRTCLREICDGPAEEKTICNAVNCKEVPEESSQGFVLDLKDMTIYQVALVSDVIVNVTARLLTDHCQQNGDECCQSMDYRYALPPGNGVPFIAQRHVFIGKGYPKDMAHKESVHVKLLVYLADDEVSSVCGQVETSGSRRKRETSGRYFDRSDLRGIISKNIGAYQTELGVDVGIADLPRQSRVNLAIVIACAVGGAFCLIIVITMIVKGKLYGSRGLHVVSKPADQGTSTSDVYALTAYKAATEDERA